MCTDVSMKQRRRGFGLVLGLMGLLMADLAMAEDRTRPPFGVFEILEGQGVEVCEACLKGFEAAVLAPDPVVFSGCERTYEFALDFTTPKWVELDPLEHLALVKQVMMFIRPPDPSRGIEGTIYDGKNFRREIQTEVKYERLSISLAMVDIDNDGQTEPVFRYRWGICGNPGAPSPFRSLIVLNHDRKGIDKTKTEVLAQNDSKERRLPLGIASDNIYDVFLYRGQVYFDSWNRSRAPTVVTVYLLKGNR